MHKRYKVDFQYLNKELKASFTTLRLIDVTLKKLKQMIVVKL
jgi:hypothetical protein